MNKIKTMTISYILKCYYENTILLPSIQREYTWGKEGSNKIFKLFDSLMCCYPIGSILIWEVKEEYFANFDFYKFIDNYNSKDILFNKKAELIPCVGLEVFSVLDGQQRITSMYLGVMENKFNGQSLYVNISKKNDNVEDDNTYIFKFIQNNDRDAIKEIKNKYLVKKKDGYYLKISLCIQNEYEFCLVENQIKAYFNKIENHDIELTQEILSRIKTLTSTQLHCYKISKNTTYNDVVKIFCRLNSQGVALTKEELLIPILYSKYDMREKFHNLLSYIDLRRVDIGVILKICLMFFGDASDELKYENLIKAKKNIENNYESIENIIKISSDFLKRYCYYNKDLYITHFPLLIVSYILYSITFNRETQEFNKNVLSGIHNCFLRKNKDYNELIILLKKITFILFFKNSNKFKNHKLLFEYFQDISHKKNIKAKDFFDHVLGENDELKLNVEDIGIEIEHYSYDNKTKSNIDYVFLFLYGENKDIYYNIDHIFPRTKNKGNNGVESIFNLQYISQKDNEIKGDKDPRKWLIENFKDEVERKKIMDDNFLPKEILDEDYDIKQLIEDRKKLLSNAIYEKINKL